MSLVSGKYRKPKPDHIHDQIFDPGVNFETPATRMAGNAGIPRTESKASGARGWVAGASESEKEVETERTGFPQVSDGEHSNTVLFRGASRDPDRKPDLLKCKQPVAATTRLPSPPSVPEANIPLTAQKHLSQIEILRPGESPHAQIQPQK